MTPLRVELAAWLKGLAWLDIGFFGLCFVVSWQQVPPVSLIFLFFVGLGVFLLLVLGPLEMDDTFIRHTSPFTGRCQMNWDEVERVEMAKGNGDMVLHGREKRLALPGTNLWSGQEKERMIELFNTQIKQRGIKVERTSRAAWQMSKGARIN